MTGLTRAVSGYRGWFLLDGVITGANAVVYLALHLALPRFLGGTSGLYLVVGSVLLVVAACLLVVAALRSRPRIAPELLVGINAVWVVASLLVAVLDPFDLSAWGAGWALVQAAIVAAFAVLQARALAAHAAARPIGIRVP